MWRKVPAASLGRILISTTTPPHAVSCNIVKRHAFYLDNLHTNEKRGVWSPISWLRDDIAAIVPVVNVEGGIQFLGYETI